MEKKLLWVVLLGMAVSLLLLFILQTKVSLPGQEKSSISRPAVISPTPAPLVSGAFVKLSASLPASVSVGESFVISIMLDSGKNIVNGVQLELSYDPSALVVNSVTGGSFFANPLEIANKNDKEKGQITYAVGSLSEQKGEGTVATLSATAVKSSNGKKVEILVIKQTSIITNPGSKTSVLKESKGAELVIR